MAEELKLDERALQAAGIAVLNKIESASGAYVPAYDLAEVAVSAYLSKAAPVGWVCVPREPTQEMIEAAVDAVAHGEDVDIDGDRGAYLLSRGAEHVYRLMISAAPLPPGREG